MVQRSCLSYAALTMILNRYRLGKKVIGTYIESTKCWMYVPWYIKTKHRNRNDEVLSVACKWDLPYPNLRRLVLEICTHTTLKTNSTFGTFSGMCPAFGKKCAWKKEPHWHWLASSLLLSVQKKNFPLNSWTAITAKMKWNRRYTTKMLNTFLSELMTQSKTAFNFGTLLMVLRGLSTRSTRRDFMVPKFSPPELPLQSHINLRSIFKPVIQPILRSSDNTQCQIWHQCTPRLNDSLKPNAKNWKWILIIAWQWVLDIRFSKLKHW